MYVYNNKERPVGSGIKVIKLSPLSSPSLTPSPRSPLPASSSCIHKTYTRGLRYTTYIYMSFKKGFSRKTDYFPIIPSLTPNNSTILKKKSLPPLAPLIFPPLHPSPALPILSTKMYNY